MQLQVYQQKENAASFFLADSSKHFWAQWKNKNYTGHLEKVNP